MTEGAVAGGGDGGAEVRETHVSILVFLGDRVLKLRKPVRFDFVDFTTQESRREDCEREVALNARLAPDVYLGTADVVLGGRAIDHAVVMRRLPADRALDRLLQAPSPLLDARLRAVAATVADFHRHAARSAAIASAGAAPALAARLAADAHAIERFAGPVLGRGEFDAVVALGRRFLAGREALFDARIRAGHVCDGHGDLQAADIYCLDDGPRILDCLEFDDRLRYGDVVADVAFLAMDLERLGCPGASARFVEAYEEASGEAIPPALLHFYVASRALVRVKVACLRHEPGGAAAGGEARDLLALARRHLEAARVRLVLVGGLPGSGKTTLARRLGDALGATVLRSDCVRRARHEPRKATQEPPAFGRGRYRGAATEAVYDELLDRAAELLGTGRSVVVDASWTSEARRRRARSLAERAVADLAELRCSAPRPTREARIAGRARAATDASEATAAIGRAMAAAEDPWPEAVPIATETAPDDVLARALASLGVAPGGPP